jgi:hypothetical protein
MGNCIESFQKNTLLPLEIVAVMDPDDKKHHLYKELRIDKRIEAPMGKTAPELFNVAAEAATGDFLMLVNDDNVMVTEGWDQWLRFAIPDDGIYVAWPNGQAGQCVNPVVSRRWYEMLGWFLPLGFEWFYADTALHSLGAMVGRLVYLPQVHCNSTMHKHPFPQQMKRDRVRLEQFKQGPRLELAKKIWAMMEE